MKLIYIILTIFIFNYGLSEETTKTIVHNYPSNMSEPFKVDKKNYAPEQIKKLIKSAKKNVDIEVFYIFLKKDSTLNNKIIKTLINRAKHNVKIRILVDNKFYTQYKDYRNSCDYLNSFKNITCKPTKEFSDSVMHAKMIVVDNKSFYIGSHNFDWITFELNHELGIIVKNDDINAIKLENSFNKDWKNRNKVIHNSSTYNETPKKKITSPAVTTTPDVTIKNYPKSNLNTFINLINSSKSSIYMQAMIISGIDPYIGSKNWHEFTEALINATKRNVRIQIMFSDWMFSKESYKDSNKWLQELIRKANLKNLKIKYTTLPIEKQCIPFSEVNHAKYAIFDKQTSWVSTSNIQKSYFYNSRNYSYVANDKNVSNQLINIFDQLWNSKYAHLYTKPVGVISIPSC